MAEDHNDIRAVRAFAGRLPDIQAREAARLASLCDELAVRRQYASADEDTLIEAAGVNRRLRSTMVESIQLARRGLAQASEKVMLDELRRTDELGLGLKIIVIMVGDDQTEEDLRVKVNQQITNYFARSAPATYSSADAGTDAGTVAPAGAGGPGVDSPNPQAPR